VIQASSDILLACAYVARAFVVVVVVERAGACVVGGAGFGFGGAFDAASTVGVRGVGACVVGDAGVGGVVSVVGGVVAVDELDVGGAKYDGESEFVGVVVGRVVGKVVVGGVGGAVASIVVGTAAVVGVLVVVGFVAVAAVFVVGVAGFVVDERKCVGLRYLGGGSPGARLLRHTTYQAKRIGSLMAEEVPSHPGSGICCKTRNSCPHTLYQKRAVSAPLHGKQTMIQSVS
jgi:hypothetical protein